MNLPDESKHYKLKNGKDWWNIFRRAYSQESVINIYFFDKDFFVVHINNNIFMLDPEIKKSIREALSSCHKNSTPQGATTSYGVSTSPCVSTPPSVFKNPPSCFIRIRIRWFLPTLQCFDFQFWFTGIL